MHGFVVEFKKLLSNSFGTIAILKSVNSNSDFDSNSEYALSESTQSQEIYVTSEQLQFMEPAEVFEVS